MPRTRQGKGSDHHVFIEKISDPVFPWAVECECGWIPLTKPSWRSALRAGDIHLKRKAPAPPNGVAGA